MTPSGIDGRVRTRGRAWEAWATTLRARHAGTRAAGRGAGAVLALGPRRRARVASGGGTATIAMAVHPVVRVRCHWMSPVHVVTQPATAGPRTFERHTTIKRTAMLERATVGRLAARGTAVRATPTVDSASAAALRWPAPRVKRATAVPVGHGPSAPLPLPPFVTAAPTHRRAPGITSTATERAGRDGLAPRRVATSGRPDIAERAAVHTRLTHARRRVEGARSTSPLLRAPSGPSGQGATRADATDQTRVAPVAVPVIPSVEHLTEQVVREIDRRILAHRERMGRGAF